MSRIIMSWRFPVIGVAAVAGLALAGCGSSSSGGSTAASSASASPASSAAAAASSAPWPLALGNTWTYDSSAFGVTGTTVNKVAAITPASDGQHVTMDTSTTAGGTTTNSSEDYVFYNNGSISYPFGQLSAGNTTVSMKVLSGSGLVWPKISALAAGQVSHSTLSLQLGVGGQTLDTTAHVTVRGGGSQHVSVPAGAYTANVVDMTIDETVDGIAVSTEVQTWLADGVGPVQTVTTSSENGKTEGSTKEVLTSFTKG